MSARRIAGFLVVAALLGWAQQITQTPTASAAPCPDVEALFARGTDDPAGLGPVGEAFVDALRAKVNGRSLGVYPVDYPATNNWSTGIDGVRDAVTHIQSTAATCPKTRMVLGGFSQGAAVMGFATADAVPAGVDRSGVPEPMPPEVADHVAAVVLFGTPSDRVMSFVGEPPVVIGPLYAAKTIQLCAPEDPICSEGSNFAAHLSYAGNPVVDQGADYAAARL